MKYHIDIPIKGLTQQSSFSQRRLASVARLSRSCLRKILKGEANVTIESLTLLASCFNRELVVLAVPANANSEFSTIAVAFKVERDGFNSWKIHFMELVDEFRRSLDPRLVMLAPPRNFDRRLVALLASTVTELCWENGLNPPAWASRRYYLDSPWFVSGIESLKATSILESPLAFRFNNIFVQSNFLTRF